MEDDRGQQPPALQSTDFAAAIGANKRNTFWLCALLTLVLHEIVVSDYFRSNETWKRAPAIFKSFSSVSIDLAS